MDSICGDNIISINVGGTIYMTTLNLICRYRNSRLCEIVLEKLKDMPDLDRSRFEYILDFLRDGVLICENDINVLTRILIEAVYFKLFSLIKILKKKIELLYSNMGSNVNKNIFKSIMGTLEEKNKNKIKSKSKSKSKSKEKNNSLSRKLNKFSALIKKHNEMKCCTVKKKKIHNFHFLSKINLLSELNHEDESPTKEEVNVRGYTLLSGVPLDSCKEEKQIASVKDQGDKLKNDAHVECNNDRELNSLNNLPKIIPPNPCTPPTHNKTLDYNITNNFINEEDKLKSKNKANGSTRINCLVKNIERKEYPPPTPLSPNGHLKNGDSKTVSFAEGTSIFIYSKKDERAHNGAKDAVDTFTESPNKSLSPSTIGGANYPGYSSLANYATCANFMNTTNDVDRASYKYNNYTYNHVNNPRGQILVYSEIDDIEETSPFPILSNVNLGEQIFSTTVDF
ncbi:K+ channel tetramerisation domain containing protein [Plasmodium cynomolgi strain B]|uniref:K+ channel tetramerisation domain containing protein n=1 Tax=Plasmodium cynomolgi (strain B) TaxID=1120755 RepID=K6V1Y7_PLACD|nr:K+ channel tetramerisation domain containing protein [Plasmodium cynomolgi strain B]GAB69215.1 K+ channel tetramerisation domain containing protein [Plasmodium cynomolgi strain B]